MSRKRKKRSAAAEKNAADAAPAEEILAEGSGAVAVAVEAAEPVELDAGAEEIPADVAALAEAAEALTEGSHEAAGEVLSDEVLSDEVLSDEVEAGAEDAAELSADAAPEGEAGEAGEVVEGGEGAALPTSAGSMDAVQLKQLVEALIFAADKPLTVQRLRQLTRVADTARLEATLAEIAKDYEDRGLVLHQVSGGYQFRTRPQFSAWVQQLIQGRPVRLSRAQLETLAIVAYRQPITRPEIDDIRGVDSSATLKLLMDRQLIRALGKKEEVGRPTLFGTTKEFLDFFSLGDLRELPTLREYSELTDESRQVMTARLGISPDGPSAAPADDAAPEATPEDALAAGSDSHIAVDEVLAASPEPEADPESDAESDPASELDAPDDIVEAMAADAAAQHDEPAPDDSPSDPAAE